MKKSYDAEFNCTTKPSPQSSSYFKLINYSLKSDLVAAIFIFGWVCMLLSVEILSFQFGSLTAKFYQVLPRKNGQEFEELLVRFGTFLVMMALGKGSLMATRGLLARAMRRNLTQFFHEKYVKLSGLKLTNQSSSILDNPDQRITEDVDKFTKGLIEISETTLMAPVLIIFYTFQVSQRLGLASLAMIYTHFLVSVLVLRLGMERLKDLTVKKEKRESNFRFEHVNLRNNSESFYLINSGPLLKRLHQTLNNQLRQLLFTTKQLIITESVMELGKNLFSYSGALLNFVLLAGELIWGRWRTESDVATIANLISMTSFLSLYLIFQLSRLAGSIDLIGILNGQAVRLNQLMKILDGLKDTNEEAIIESKSIEAADSKDDFEVEFNDFKSKNPMLYSNNSESGLSLKIKSSEGNVLVSGPNGSGKTSILRFISGLWGQGEEVVQSGTLRIKMPINLIRPFFMTCPQNTVIFSGSLYDILGIKNREPSVDADEESVKDQSSHDLIEETLNIVGLSQFLLEPFDIVRSISTWQTILSPGQHQRLSLARAIIHRPHILALDETCLSMTNKEVQVILEVLAKQSIKVIYVDPAESTSELDQFFPIKIKTL